MTDDADDYLLARRVAQYEAAIGAAFTGVRLDDFAAPVTEAALRWVADPIGTLMVVGTKGVGKTQLVLCIGRELTRQGARVAFLPVHRLVALAGETISGNRDAAETIRRFTTADVLLLDDLGAHRVTDFTRDVIAELVDTRWTSQLPIAATTNVTAEALVEVIGDRAASRLWHNSSLIHLGGDDRRATTTAPLAAARNGNRAGF